jgi:hypothetical protein
MVRYLFLLVLLFALSSAASAGVITYDRYNNGNNLSSCNNGVVSFCQFSGWWSYGNTTVSTNADSGTYTNGIGDVAWIAAGKTVTDIDGYGTYNGINTWGYNWGSGSQRNDSTTNTNSNWSNSFADTSGYLSLAGGNSYTTDLFAGFYSYYYTCNTAGLCTQYSTSNSNLDRSYQATGWWTSFNFGQYQDSGSWQDAYRQQFPDARFDVYQYNLDGSPVSNTPEPGTAAMMGIGLLGAAALMRRRRQPPRIRNTLRP